MRRWCSTDRRDRDNLAEIIKHAEIAIAYAETVADLRVNGMVTDAVCLHLGQIGEFARTDRISQAMQDAIPAVPWAELRGMRNRIFHDYGNVDVDVVIDIVENYLPALIIAINGVVTD